MVCARAEKSVPFNYRSFFVKPIPVSLGNQAGQEWRYGGQRGGKRQKAFSFKLMRAALVVKRDDQSRRCSMLMLDEQEEEVRVPIAAQHSHSLTLFSIAVLG